MTNNLKTFSPTPVDFSLDGRPPNVCLQNQLGLIKKCLAVVDGVRDPSKALLENVSAFELPDRITVETKIQSDSDKLTNRADGCLKALEDAQSGVVANFQRSSLQLSSQAKDGFFPTVSTSNPKELENNFTDDPTTQKPVKFEDAETTSLNIISSEELMSRIQNMKNSISGPSLDELKNMIASSVPAWQAPTHFLGKEPAVFTSRNKYTQFAPVGTGDSWHWRSDKVRYMRSYDNYNMSANSTTDYLTIPEDGLYFLSYDENIAYNWLNAQKANEDALPTQTQSVDPSSSPVAITMVIAYSQQANQLLRNLVEECYYLPSRYQIYSTILSVCVVAKMRKGDMVRFGFKYNAPTNLYTAPAIKCQGFGGMHIAQLNYFPDPPV